MPSTFESILRTPKTNSIVGSLSKCPIKVPTVDDLRAIVPADVGLTDGQQIELAGYYGPDDAGGGLFYYDAASVEDDNGGTIFAPDSGDGRYYRIFDGPVNIRWFGAIGDAAHNAADTDALQAALDTGLAVYIPPADASAWNFEQFTINSNYQQIFGEAGQGGTIVNLLDATTGCIIGNSVSQILDVAFTNIKFVGLVGQTAFWSKYVRGLTFENCTGTFDRFIDLGDGNTLGAPTYVFELYDCEFHHIAAATKHFIRAWNFQGQFDYTNTFTEGLQIAGLDGFYATDNIQARIDHIIVQGGYFSRFRDNWSFVDARVVNAYWSNHLSELALRNAFRFEVTSSTAKATGSVGGEYLNFSNVNLNATGHGFYFKVNRASVEIASVLINGVQFTTAGGLTSDGLIYAEGSLGYLDGFRVFSSGIVSAPTNGACYGITIAGPYVRNLSMDNIEIKGSGTNWLVGVYLSSGGSFTDINIGVVNGEFTTTYVSDTTGKALIQPNYTYTTTTSAINFGTVGANATVGDNILHTGVKAGDEVTVTDLTGVAGIVFTGWINTDNSIYVRANNVTTGGIVTGTPSLRIVVRGWR